MVKIKNKKVQYNEVEILKGVVIQYRDKLGLHEETVLIPALEKFRQQHSVRGEHKEIAIAMLDYFNRTLTPNDSKRKYVRLFNIFETTKYVRND